MTEHTKCKCESFDICTKFKTGECTVAQQMCIGSIIKCSQRELTDKGKQDVRSGKRV